MVSLEASRIANVITINGSGRRFHKILGTRKILYGIFPQISRTFTGLNGSRAKRLQGEEGDEIWFLQSAENGRSSSGVSSCGQM